MVVEQRQRANAPCGDFGRTPEGAAMKVLFKITERLLGEAKTRLARAHPFASERVGFLLCRVGLLENGDQIILSHSLHDAPDDDYPDDPSVGAMLGPGAVVKTLQTTYT